MICAIFGKFPYTVGVSVSTADEDDDVIVCVRVGGTLVGLGLVCTRVGIELDHLVGISLSS